MMEWISVKDRLPNESIPVLAIDFMYDYFVLELDSGEWVNLHGYSYNMENKFDIIYWKQLDPLPDGVIKECYDVDNGEWKKLSLHKDK